MRSVIVTAVIAGAVGLMIWAGVEYKYHVFPKRFAAVEQGSLYRSGQMTSTVVERTFRKNDIRVVVDLTGYLPDSSEQRAEEQAVERLGIEHHRFPLGGDGTGDIRAYADALQVMHEAQRKGDPVLVHCSAGTERTGAAIGFYQLLVLGNDPDEVMDGIVRAGHRPHRNTKMIPYMNEHMEELAAMLVERGVLTAPPEKVPKLGRPQ